MIATKKTVSRAAQDYQKKMEHQISRVIKAQFANGKLLTHRQPAFINADDSDGKIHSYRSDSELRPDRVYFVNAASGRFDETYFDEPLTNYLVGYRDPNNIEDSLNMVAPAVPVNRRFSFKAAENYEEFLSEIYDDQRAIGSDFKRVIYSGETIHSQTTNRGLMLIVDLDNVPDADKEVAASGDVPTWQGQKVAKLTRRLYRNSFRRAISALATAAVQIPLIWDKTAGVNPDIDIQAGLVSMTSISGIRPNRVVYGDTSFLFRNQSYGSQNNPAGYLGYNPNVEGSLAAALQVDMVKVCRERYQTSATAKGEILGPNVYAFFAQDDVDTEDPSNIKRFVSMFSKEQGGGMFRVYVQQLGSKLVALTVEFYELTVVTSAGGIAQFSITGPQ